MARLLIHELNRQRILELGDDFVSVGRDAKNTIIIDDPFASREHCVIKKVEGKYLLIDLNSSNGSFINGKRIVQHVLKHGDRLELGKATIIFESDSVTSTATTAAHSPEIPTPAANFLIHVTADPVAPLPLSKFPLKIGRDKSCEIQLDDRRISSFHAEIDFKGSDFIIRDLESTNGTFVDGKRISSHLLLPGNVIEIGNNRFVFETNRPTHVPRQPYLITHKTPEREETFPLNHEVTTIGRYDKNDIVIEDNMVSNYHAVIRRRGLSFILQDLESTNGTFLNGNKVAESQVFPGDRIQIGRSLLLFQNPYGFPPSDRLKLDPTTIQEKAVTSAPPTATWLRKVLEKHNIPVALLAGTILIIIVAVFLQLPKIPNLQDSSITAPIENLLTINPCFEIGQIGESGIEPGWKVLTNVPIKIKLDTENVKSGKRSLLLTNIGQSEDPNKTVVEYDHLVPVDTSHAYEVSSWVTARGDHGIFGIRVVWSSETAPYLREVSSATLPLRLYEWTKVGDVFFPPRWATHLAFAVFCEGQWETVGIDHTNVKQVLRHETDQELEYAVLGKSLRISKMGIISLTSAGTTQIWDIQVMTTDGRARQESLVLTHKPMLQPNASRFTGKLFDHRLQDWIDLTLTVMASGDDVDVTYELSSRSSKRIPEVNLVFSLRKSLLNGGALQCGTQHGIEELLPRTTLGKVREIILPPPLTPIVLWLDPPAYATLQELNGYTALVLGFPHVSKDKLLIDVRLRGESLVQREAYKAMLARARQLRDRNEYGAALRVLRETIARFHDHPDKIMAARAELDAIEKPARESLSAIVTELSNLTIAQETTEPVDIEELERRRVRLRVLKDQLESLIERYAGSAIAEEATCIAENIQKVLPDIETAIANARTIVANQTAEKLLSLAKTALENKEWTKCETFCKNIIDQFPDTFYAKEATDLLARLALVQKTIKERERFINGQISKARSFAKNNMFEEAIEAYQMLLERYPDYENADEVRKEIDRLRRAAGQ